jgi:hypothetical protein
MKSLLASILITTVLVANFAYAQDSTGPVLALSSNKEVVNGGQQLKVTVSTSQVLKGFNADQISLVGGKLESIRKLSKRSYLLMIRASKKGSVNIQISMEQVQNQKGEYNQEPSNELNVPIIEQTGSKSTQSSSMSLPDFTNKLPNLLDSTGIGNKLFQAGGSN